MEFFLTVSSETQSSTTQQTVFFTSSTQAQLVVKIFSPDIVGQSFDPTKAIRLEGQCQSCGSSLDVVVYKWSLVSGSTQINLEDSSLVPTGINNRFLKISPGVLQEGGSYVLQLDVSQGLNTGFSQQSLTTNQPPQNGTCTVSPTSGDAGSTKFTISCTEWADDPLDEPFSYRYSFIRDPRSRPEPLKFTAESSYETVLPAGINGQESFIEVQIADTNGATAYFRIPQPIVVSLPTITNEADYFGTQLQTNSELNVIASTGDVTGTVGRVNVYANVLNDLGTSSDSTKLTQRKDYRKSFISLVDSVVSTDNTLLDTEIESVTQSLETITLRPEEIDTSTQLTASSTVTKLIQSSKNIGKITANFSQSAVATIDNVFKAVKLGNTANGTVGGTVDISLASGVNKEHTKNVSSQLIASLQELSTLVTSTLVQGEPPQIIQSDTIEFVSQRSDPLTFDSIAQGSAKMKLPSTGFLQTLLTNSSDSLDTQLTVVKDNLYTWSTTASSITSGNVIIELRSSSGESLTVKDTASDIEIDIPQGTSESDTRTNISDISEAAKLKVFSIKPLDSSNYVLLNASIISPTTGSLGLLASQTSSVPTQQNSDFTSTVTQAKPAQWLLTPPTGNNGTWSIAVNNPGNANVTFLISYMEANCKFWDAGTEVWSTQGCKLSALSTFEVRKCLCNHLTGFGSGTFVAPNAVDFVGDAELLSELLSNPLVLTVIIAIYCIFGVLIYYAYKKDKKDVLKIFPVPLKDNRAEDRSLYEIALKTGVYPGSGTDAHIYIRIFGEYGESGPRELHRSGWVDNFYPNAVDKFILAHPDDFGEIRFVQIWHDNSGISPGWYLKNFAVRNLKTGQKWQFICESWLDEEEEEGSTEIMIEPATLGELHAWGKVFKQKTTNEFLDGHLWVSIFTRPVQSNFTRVQRLLCLMNFIISSMAISALWFETTDPSQNEIILGITPQEIYVGIVAAMMVFPINLLIIQIFRHARSGTRLREKEKLCRALKQEAIKDQLGIKRKSMFNIAMGLANVGGVAQMFADPIKKTQVVPLEGESKEVKTPVKQREVKTLKDFKRYSGPLEVDDNEQARTEWPSRPHEESSLEDRAENVTIESEIESNVAIDDYVETLEKKKRGLPPWSKAIAYVLIFFVCSGGTYLILLLGVKFGSSKSSAWLRTFFISVCQSAIITQPLKIVVLTFLFTLACKKKSAEKLEEDNDEDESVYELTVPTVNPKTGEVIQVNHKPAPNLDKQTVGNAKRIRKITKTVILYILFIALVSVLMYGELDKNSYYMTKDIEDIFINKQFDISISNPKVFGEIKNGTEFYLWASQVLVPGLFYEKLPNNIPVPRDGYLSDYENYLLGYARLRQLRVENNSCTVPSEMDKYVTKCVAPYSSSDEMTFPYGPGSNWTYSENLNAMPFWGKQKTYPGEGYTAILNNSAANATSTLLYLEENNWIDDQTRFVMVEFNVYNTNVNLFVVCRLALEFLPIGGVNTSVSIWTAKLFRYRTGFDWLLLFLECVFFCILIRLAVLQRKKIRKEGFKAYIRQLVNQLEVAIIICGIISVCLYFNRAVVVRILAKDIESNATEFHSYQKAAVWDTISRLSMAFTGFLIYLKFLKLVSFNATISQNMLHMRKTLRVMTGFAIMFLIVFMSFVFWGNITFHSMVEEYRTFGQSVFSLFSTSLGKFDYSSLENANRFLGPLIFFLFVLMMLIILSVFFAALLINCTPNREEKDELLERQYEVISYLMFKMGKMVGKNIKMKQHDEKIKTPVKEIHANLMHRLNEVEGMLDWIKYEQSNTPRSSEAKQASDSIREEPAEYDSESKPETQSKDSKKENALEGSSKTKSETSSSKKKASIIRKDLNLPNFIPGGE